LGGVRPQTADRMGVMPRLRPEKHAPRAGPLNAPEDVPGQLLLFPSLAGRSTEWDRIRFDYPSAADAKLVGRLEAAGRRLRRGAVLSTPKLNRAVPLAEALASLFDSQ